MSTHPHVQDFVAWAETHEAPLARAVGRLEDGPPLDDLARLLERFDREGDGRLTDHQAWLAARLLRLLHRLSHDGFLLTAQALDYLDLNANSRIDFDEVAMAVEVFEMFCKADSVNDTLSVKELRMLIAVLRHSDGDQDGKLDADERSRLRDALWTPDEFLAEQRATNPYLAELTT